MSKVKPSRASVEVVQSYILTVARYDFNVYEKRVLYRIVETLQQQILAEKYADGVNLNMGIFGDAYFIMPVSQFLNGEIDQNYTRVKNAFRKLSKKTIEYEGLDEDGKEEWGIASVVTDIKLNSRGSISFRVGPKVLEALSSFARGYRKYELSTVFEFESQYSMRFYELLAGQNKPISYTIESLKGMFDISHKYANRPANFIAKVIEPARKELDEKSPYSFKYLTNMEMEGSKDRSIHTIHLYPCATGKADPVKEKERARRATSLHHDFPKEIIDVLKVVYLFTDEEIKNNRQLFMDIEKGCGLLDFLSEKKRYFEGKGKGYVINTLRGKLNELKI